MWSSAELLGSDGPLARHIKGFAPRIQQQEMARAVARTLEVSSVLIVEAGTGVGKTFAYLVPALISGKKIIISTGTKTLQEQLFHRDLPVVKAALAVPVNMVMLKGRANYLCSHRQLLVEQSGLVESRQFTDHIQKIREWSGRTRSGDIAEVTNVPEDSPLWVQVTSTAENCLGQECPSFNDCHVMKARRAAQAADIVVVNHHLLFADMMLKDEGFGELLPGVDALILDEAHQLPEIATHFFGVFMSSRQMLDLARDVIAEQLHEAGDMQQLRDGAVQLEKAVYDFRLALGVKQQRAPWKRVAKEPQINTALRTLNGSLVSLQEQLEMAAERGKGLDNCRRRSEVLGQRLTRFVDSVDNESICWYETTRRGFVLHETPMDIAEVFHKNMARYKSAWVFTSATLAIGKRFDYFTNQLGLGEVETACLDSPFDYKKNALMYLPETMPEPSSRGYVSAVVDAAIPVIKACGGRTFVLFTSHRALKEASELFEQADMGFPILQQGSVPRSELLDRFRDLGNAVLLGTGSFWEGVDVRGAALSCVIIDKLPFETPDDPILQARSELLRQQGNNPFMTYQVPNAVIVLKQGVGRLIRDNCDRGVMMLCDPRLLTKSYGRIFLNNLPSMTRTRALKDVQAFFSEEGRLLPVISEEIEALSVSQ